MRWATSAFARLMNAWLHARERWLGLRSAFAKRMGFRRVAWLTFRADDPNSYLLAQAMKRMRRAYNIDVRILIVDLPDARDRPESYLFSQHAVADAAMVAETYGCYFPQEPHLPKGSEVALAHAALATAQQHGDALQTSLDLSSSIWNNDSVMLEAQVTAIGVQGDGAQLASSTIRSQSATMRRKGFYESGAVYYRGEWYRGVDRLYHLIRRLRKHEGEEVPVLVSDLARRDPWGLVASEVRRRDELAGPVEFFFTFQSPYSYIALERLLKHSEFDLRYVQLVLRPMMPSDAERYVASLRKKRYIVADAYREAARHGVPFGRMSDPRDQALIQCMRAFYATKQVELEHVWTLAAMRAIWSEGANLSSARVVADVAARAGAVCSKEQLEAWPIERWEIDAEINRRDLNAHHLWGVPTVSRGSVVVWGQDRLPLVLRGTTVVSLS